MLLLCRIKMIDLPNDGKRSLRIVVSGGCTEGLLVLDGDFLPVWQADAAEVLGLEAEASAVHFGRVGTYEEVGDSGS
jgi:hypothetical protein